MVREGAVIPHIALAQSTAQMDWSKLDLVVYSKDSKKADGLVCLPSENVLHKVTVLKTNNRFTLETDPFGGKVSWKVRLYPK